MICVASLPLLRGHSNVHDFWSLGSIGIDVPVSSMTDSVESIIEGKSSKTDENRRYFVALP